MFSTVVVLALAASSALAGLPRKPSNAACAATTGTQMCCNTVSRHVDPSVDANGKQSGIANVEIDKAVGDVQATGCYVGSGCSQQALCCNGIVGGGLLNLSCLSIAALL
ncbi:hypothetical protein HGRIS_006204 [Hohenbuehelia grisea]|uniref:Hydrophobin n=1 Tax=Hohenbuehelia grisea TaxID=104357 RepID=A0ABR3K1Y5_9AGAR